MQRHKAVSSNKQGDRNVRLSTYTEGVPTLFVDKNTLITLVSDADLSRNDDERKQQFVPLHELARMIGERAQWISENVLLAPGLSGDEWQRLQRHSSPAVCVRCCPSISAGRGDLSFCTC